MSNKRGIRTLALTVCLLAVLLQPSSVVAHSESEHQLEIEFDGRAWEVGFMASRGKAHLVEWVLEGESVCCWSEIVSWQYFEGWHGHQSPRELMRQLRHRRTIQSPTVEWDLLSEDFDSVLFTWKIESPQIVGSYFELARIIKHHDVLHIIHYAALDREVFAMNLDTWIECLGAIDLS